MGFFSSILGGSKTSSSSGGFNQLPAEISGAYKDFGQQIQDLLGSGNLTNMYKPLAQTAGETKAYGNIDQGFAPTAQTLKSDISMQQNPYDQYVIDEINRQSGGEYSILKQAQNAAGQSGSNRGMLGANDIDLSRLNQIGSFKQQGYNTALQNALTTLPGARQQDAQNQLGAGANQRDLAGQESQAPLIALQQLASALGILPTAEGSTSSSTKTSSGLAGLAQAGATAYAKSDIHLKENITHIGESNGFPLYTFQYKGEPELYQGVMAQDVLKSRPDAVMQIDGFLAVDYSKIGVEFKRVQ